MDRVGPRRWVNDGPQPWPVHCERPAPHGEAAGRASGAVCKKTGICKSRLLSPRGVGGVGQGTECGARLAWRLLPALPLARAASLAGLGSCLLNGASIRNNGPVLMAWEGCWAGLLDGPPGYVSRPPLPRGCPDWSLPALQPCFGVLRHYGWGGHTPCCGGPSRSQPRGKPITNHMPWGCCALRAPAAAQPCPTSALPPAGRLPHPPWTV